MSIMAEELGLRRRLVIPVPVLTPRLSSYWIQLITPLSNAIASPLAEGLKNPVVCRENRITGLVPQELLGVREAIHAALNKMAEHGVETSWSMAGPFQATQIGLAEPFSVTSAKLPWKHLRGRSFARSAGRAVAMGGTPRIFSGRSADGWIS